MTPRAAFLALNGVRLYRVIGAMMLARDVVPGSPVLIFSPRNAFWHRSHVRHNENYEVMPWEFIENALAFLSQKDIDWICGL
jgi:hypothetical protein